MPVIIQWTGRQFNAHEVDGMSVEGTNLDLLAPEAALLAHHEHLERRAR